MPDFNRKWTDAMDELLIKHWQNGETATTIYRSGLFPGVSRNAIIGRLFRLRKKRGEQIVEHRDPDPAPPKKRKRRPNYSASEHAPRKPTPVKAPSIPDDIAPRWLTLFDLGPADCRYIVTPTLSHEYLYCALPAPDVDAFGNNCYCRFHQKVMRSPSPLRRL